MKMPGLCLIIASAGAAGLGTGWLLWSGNGPGTDQGGAVSRAISGARAGKMGTRHTGRVGAGRGAGGLSDEAVGHHATEVLADELAKIKALTPQEFGVAATDLWLASPSPENLMCRGLYLRALTGERAEQFYLEYKRRKGLGHWDNCLLGELFITAGSQDGRDFLERLLKASPNGFCELECVTHGWALTDAQGAVDWLNALPDSAPYYHKALLGMMWGLAQNSPAQAMQVYATLDPGLSGGALASIGQSTVDNHGIKGLAELLASTPDANMRRSLFDHSLGYAHRKPPADFVRHMAGSLANSPWMQEQYNEKAARWAATDPDNALSWTVKMAEESGSAAAIGKLAATLAALPGKTEALRTWVAAHPGAPGRQVIEEALAGGVAATGR